METLSSAPLTTARSRSESSSKSPTAIEFGKSPTAKSFAAPNVPSPFPKRMETLSSTLLTTARSRSESSSKSPTAIDPAPFPTAKSFAAPNVPSPFPKRMETSSVIKFSYSQIKDSRAEIYDRYSTSISTAHIHSLIYWVIGYTN